eukprot:CAMPEP_0183303098 /NCGR_PEP_ID=MMETSP0160_2-20130417/8663_1 /TAXON_ID=2839 ORGANISM="Odontella Sinensis, Strain Grunow 1884" /NCGR_SAMPLE_ID=MMETSP0160_2 /ASSEMBLY_ACC=CAM_ASM_000250 /LENGTH=74 /DNA_ID=CAMNT_0025465957 /DNA_START=598 /DNA_END=822 /DNA_ORIENTATION=+
MGKNSSFIDAEASVDAPSCGMCTNNDNPSSGKSMSNNQMQDLCPVAQVLAFPQESHALTPGCEATVFHPILPSR